MKIERSFESENFRTVMTIESKNAEANSVLSEYNVPALITLGERTEQLATEYEEGFARTWGTKNES
jgi:hypothetical protein